MTLGPEAFRFPWRPYRHVFLAQDRAAWRARPFPYDPAADLVLTFDFGLAEEVRSLGGTAAYLDHAVRPPVLEPHNVEIQNFLSSWFQAADGSDLFSFQGLDIGHALRMDVWNTFAYYTRLILNLQAVARVPHERLFAGLDDASALDLLARLGLKAEAWSWTPGAPPAYFFPVQRWMSEHIRPRGGAKRRLREWLTVVVDGAAALAGKMGRGGRDRAEVFVQRYYPTESVVDLLKRDSRVNLVVENYTWRAGFWRERRLRPRPPTENHRRVAAALLARWTEKRSRRWTIDGFSVSDALYAALADKLAAVLPVAVSAAESVVDDLRGRPFAGMIYVTTLSLVNRLVAEYCHRRGLPTFFIMNGLLLHHFPEEDVSETTAINSYGEVIKNDYFKGDPRVVCLGDPRLDAYVRRPPRRRGKPAAPVFLIGTSGYSDIDLNSYTAVEFEFLNDLLRAFRELRRRGRKFTIRLKVRTNGYRAQYAAFGAEYFPDLPLDLCREASFAEALETADFYISIYSGTHFEAACRGIPSLYYKNDSEDLIAPYDGKSELVTARTAEEAVERLEQFFRGDPVYDAFRERRVLEKYVGPLDGQNARRNVDYLYGLLRSAPPAAGAAARVAASAGNDEF